MLERFWEVDVLRGVGIVMVVFYHFFFDLNLFGVLPNAMYSGAWLLFQRAAASLLLFVVGVSLAISRERRGDDREFFRHCFKRSMQLFAVALGITAVTLVYPGRGFIAFGVLHFIALSILLSCFFARFKWGAFAGGVTAIVAGLAVAGMSARDNFFFWLGFHSPEFYSLDYFPVLPWFGVVLLGLFAGETFYAAGKRTYNLWLQPGTLARALSFFGRHSLFIYLAHQPIIFSVLFLAT
ncbi:MAG: heparan-alpha-glucosaminide N-acetyltransferase [Candidatus Micrarchaeia archaeon]